MLQCPACLLYPPLDMFLSVIVDAPLITSLMHPSLMHHDSTASRVTRRDCFGLPWAACDTCMTLVKP
jgi:hypothetical protein